MGNRLASIGLLGIGFVVSAVALAQPQASPCSPGSRPERPRGGALSASPSTAPKPLLTASVDPRQYGTQDYRITVISATQFVTNFSDNETGVDAASLSDTAGAASTTRPTITPASTSPRAR